MVIEEQISDSGIKIEQQLQISGQTIVSLINSLELISIKCAFIGQIIFNSSIIIIIC